MPLDVRSERTLRALGDAAVDLYLERDEVTVDEIAARAGVSRRTAFRHIEAKEDLVFVHPVLWLDVFDAAAAQYADLAAWPRVRAASRSLAGHIEADPEPVRRAMSAAALHARFGRGAAAIHRRWVERIAVELADGGSVERSHRIRAAATMAAIDEALSSWSEVPASSLTREVDAVLDEVDPLFRAAAT